MKTCPFCDIYTKEKILLETASFYLVKAKSPVTHNHLILISKAHFRSEVDFNSIAWGNYPTTLKQVWSYYFVTYKNYPLVFTNPPQMQSVHHFHRHYLDGIFGIHGVASALKQSLLAKS